MSTTTLTFILDLGAGPVDADAVVRPTRRPPTASAGPTRARQSSPPAPP